MNTHQEIDEAPTPRDHPRNAPTIGNHEQDVKELHCDGRSGARRGAEKIKTSLHMQPVSAEAAVSMVSEAHRLSDAEAPSIPTARRQTIASRTTAPIRSMSVQLSPNRANRSLTAPTRTVPGETTFPRLGGFLAGATWGLSAVQPLPRS